MISSRAGDRKVVLRNVAVFGPREEDLEKLRGEESGERQTVQPEEERDDWDDEVREGGACGVHVRVCARARVCVCARVKADPCDRCDHCCETFRGKREKKKSG